MENLQTIYRKQVVTWLAICGFLVFCMIVVGGATRLTHSGLSIVEWEPIVGTMPPITSSDWNQVFDEYKGSPEYQLVNFGMSLDEFKVIFWWEYFHRLLGRLIGLVFFVPFAYFLIRRRLNSDITTRLIGIFALGGLQGAMGWYMVASGLVDDPNVSQYRLTAHLGIAFLIFGAITWTTLSILYPSRANLSPPVRNMYKFSMIVNGVIFLMVLSGGFVAGLRAGLIYNTFPLMGDNFIPPDLFVLTPLWSNFFENMITVQFDHRIIAYILALLIPIFWFRLRRREVLSRTKKLSSLLLGLLVIQMTLGVSTLMLHVPTALGVAHQAVGSLLFITSLAVTQSIASRRGMI
ncbi:MAG: COX15/CtaA family protein [Burkholderiales bacterium]|nr:COX15/CtaA family protein [Burkholderiales bacterium]OUT79608.1 MAG: heme A synthase [Betaproteobacteria bacterium TMED22]|tara:strand:- start:31217 stop:32263 length:1047 start_codon:yes stop_codon:yes gene_type:complete